MSCWNHNKQACDRDRWCAWQKAYTGPGGIKVQAHCAQVGAGGRGGAASPYGGAPYGPYPPRQQRPKRKPPAAPGWAQGYGGLGSPYGWPPYAAAAAPAKKPARKRRKSRGDGDRRLDDRFYSPAQLEAWYAAQLSPGGYYYPEAAYARGGVYGGGAYGAGGGGLYPQVAASPAAALYAARQRYQPAGLGAAGAAAALGTIVDPTANPFQAQAQALELRAAYARQLAQQEAQRAVKTGQEADVLTKQAQLASEIIAKNPGLVQAAWLSPTPVSPGAMLTPVVGVPGGSISNEDYLRYIG